MLTSKKRYISVFLKACNKIFVQGRISISKLLPENTDKLTFFHSYISIMMIQVPTLLFDTFFNFALTLRKLIMLIIFLIITSTLNT